MKIRILLIAMIFFNIVQAQEIEDKKIFSNRYIKKTMTRAALWQLKNPKHELYEWHNGALYAGLFALYEATGSRRIFKAMMEMGERNEWKPGRRYYHADDFAICQTYVDLYRIVKKRDMITPFIDTMEVFMTTQYKTDNLRRITWWWCDALFMAPPAFVKLGVTLNDKKYLELTDSLFMECYNLLYDKEELLYARDIRYKWDEPGIEVRKEANGRKIFWSRGNGWVMGGLVRVLKELPVDYKIRPFYEQHFKDMAHRIASLQQPDGLWKVSLLDPDSFRGGEASGSGFYCYALAWGINNNILDRDTYYPVVQKAWAGLNSLIHVDGRVGWVQPVAADPSKIVTADSWEVYGTGAFLLAGSEVLKLD